MALVVVGPHGQTNRNDTHEEQVCKGGTGLETEVVAHLLLGDVEPLIGGVWFQGGSHGGVVGDVGNGLRCNWSMSLGKQCRRSSHGFEAFNKKESTGK